MSIALIDKSGEIVSVLLCTPEMAETLISPGQTAILEEPPSMDCYWDLTNAKWIAKPARPSTWHTWDPASKAWADLRAIEQVRAQKNAQINDARLAANRTTFPFSGKAFSCDELSRSDIDGMNGIILLLKALPPNWIGQWKAADNTWLPIPDVPTWTQFYAAMIGQGQVNFAQAQNLKATLASATTIDQIEAIQWTTS